MKRFVHGLLAALVLFGSASAKTYTDKTFLAPRSDNTNIAMEYTTWHKQTSLIDKDKFGGTVQATGFYEESDNEGDLAKYFGVCNYDNGNSIDDFLVVVPRWETFTGSGIPPQPKHLDSGYMFHTYSVDLDLLRLADKLCWHPDRHAYGVRLDYHQKLDKIVDGLFFKVSMPIVHVKTSLGWTSSCATCDPCSTSCNTKCLDYCKKQKLQIGASAIAGTEYSVADYLTGKVVNTYAHANQKALCKAKIHNGNTDTGIADIDIMLGYNFLYKPTKHVNVTVGLTIPTGTTPDADYLWEAVVGNHGHWAFGAGLDAAFQVWKNEDKSLDFLFAFNYRYLFKSTEKRTMGMIYPTGFGTSYANKKILYGHWYLGAKKGDKFATPMANYLTRDLNVTPGSHFDGLAQVAFNWKNWTFDLGYNLFAKEAESVSLKSSSCGSCDTSCSTVSCGWEEDTYGIAKTDWDTNEAFAAANVASAITDWINRCNLNLDACTNPSVVTHKIFGGAGYAFKTWEYPLILGVGGSWEFATDNDSVEQWALWAKVGITF